jgi:hypothetical protein
MEVALVAPPADEHAPGRVVASAPLEFAGETSMYEAELRVPGGVAEGTLTVRAAVVDTERVNAGMAERTLRVRR